MEILITTAKIISIALFIWAAIATSYMFMYSIFGLLYTEKRKKIVMKESTAPRIAVIIPSYKEDTVII